MTTCRNNAEIFALFWLSGRVSGVRSGKSETPVASSDVGDKGFKCAVAKDNGQQQSVVAFAVSAKRDRYCSLAKWG